VPPEKNRLRDGFLRWQCRVRQLAMRDNFGKPDDAIAPAVRLQGADEDMGHIITVLSKSPANSLVPEFKQMFKNTQDPAQRREKALNLFSEIYYQKADTFSDILTATFPPKSEGAKVIRAADRCRLEFSAYGQTFFLDCKVWKLTAKNPLFQATTWHNMLFNPNLPPDTIVLGFEPDWSKSLAEPPMR
ncbi:MAG: hypothetical protein ACI875_002028, partial [Planctomycetota bacterium]